MTQKIFAVQCDPQEGFFLDEKFYDRVITRVEDVTEIKRDAETEEVLIAIVAAAVAEFMTTFEVKPQ